MLAVPAIDSQLVLHEYGEEVVAQGGAERAQVQRGGAVWQQLVLHHPCLHVPQHNLREGEGACKLDWKEQGEEMSGDAEKSRSRKRE